MDESFGIPGFCMGIEGGLKPNEGQAKGGGGAEGDGNWQSVVRVCSQKVCAWSSDLVASKKKSLVRTHARTQFLKPNCRRLVYRRRPIPLSSLEKTFMHVCSVVMED
jgi:hypothetical protein